jgi:transcriptional regulator with XRE-family HTH domain
MNIGEKIKQLRTDKNLTQPQLAEAIGIEQSYLSKLENDKSTPSADIFQAILKALGIDVGSFLEGIDEKIIHRQLRQIPEVANYLNTGAAYKIHNIKKWLYSSAAACVIGLTLIVSGYKSLIFGATQSEYVSRGVIELNEPKDLFENSHRYFYSNGCPQNVHHPNDPQACTDPSQNINVREKIETLLLAEYQGVVIYRNVEGGQRVYSFRSTRPGNDSPNRWLMLIGTLLTFSGLFGFFVEFHLRKI